MNEVTERMVSDACDAQEPGWRVFDASLWWAVQRGLKAALGDSSPSLPPPEPREARVEEVEELAEHLYDVLRAVTLETGAATGPPWSSVLSRRFAQVLMEYERVLHGAP